MARKSKAAAPEPEVEETPVEAVEVVEETPEVVEVEETETTEDVPTEEEFEIVSEITPRVHFSSSHLSSVNDQFSSLAGV